MMTAEFFCGDDDVTRSVFLDESDHQAFKAAATTVGWLADAIAGSGKRRADEEDRDARADEEFRLACLATIDHLGEREGHYSSFPSGSSGPEGLLHELGVVLVQVQRLTAVVKDVCDWAGGVDFHAEKVVAGSASSGRDLQSP